MIKKQNLIVSDYQKSERDFAFIVNKEVESSRFNKCCFKCGSKID